jgi:tetratricopeptide (TPR) repeat protein
MSRRTAFLLILLAGASALGKDATANWVEIRSPGFVVLTDSSEKQARHIAGQFERMRAVFHGIFPKARVDFGSPILVVAVKNKQDFQALEPAAYLAKGQMDLAGLFLRTPDKNYILLRLDVQGQHPYATVYHEYTHLLLSDAGEWLPLWLNEGLAEFFQNSDIHEKDVQLGEPSPEDLLLLRQNRLLPLPVLFKVDASSPYYHEEQKGSVFYAESWALTHMLEIADQVDHTHRLADYADLVSKHVDPVIAGERSFEDLLQLQKALSLYIARGGFRYFTVAMPKDVDESAYRARPVAQAEADAVRAEVLAYNDRAEDARALLQTVLREDPKNASAHETMGYLEFRAGKVESARDWYAQAVQLDSQSYLAHYYFAETSLSAANAGAQQHPPEDPQLAERIEASLRAAIQLNPKFAPAYDQLARLYGMRHDRLEEAHRLNLQAAELDPGNLGYRMNTAIILEEAGRPKDAISVLRAAQGLAKTPEELATVRGRIQAIEQRQPNAEANRQSIAAVATGAAPAAGDTGAVSPPPAPKHPTEAPTGPSLTAKGVVRGVQCAEPSEIEFKVEGAGRNFSFYSNNYYDIVFSAANYTPEGEIHPCADLEGMKASVQYAATSDKSVDGQILSVELSK